MIWFSGCTQATLPSNALSGIGISQIAIPTTINNVFDPSLNPVNSNVAFMGQIGDVNTNIYVLDLSTGAVTAKFPPRTYYPIGWPKWSPDGTRISFSSSDHGESNAGIWISDSSSNTESIASGIGAAWSPDGSRLAVVGSIDDKYEISIVDLATKKPETIYTVYRTNSQTILSDVDWSPDGSGLAFIVTEENNGSSVGRLYRMGIDGNNSQVLVEVKDKQFLSDPKWVLGGKWIAFLTGPALTYTLSFVKSDGQCIVSPLKNLNDIIAMDISRDGAIAVVRIGTLLYKLDINAMLAPQSLQETLTCQ